MRLPRVVVVGGKLALICVVAAVILAFVNAATEPVILENRARALREGLLAISSQANIADLRTGERVPVDDVDQVLGYFALTSGDETAGYVVQLVGVGYGGDMNILAGYYPNGEIFAARMMENLETPGLGKKAESDSYMLKFIGTGGDTSVPTRKGDLAPADADAITGATITFLGVSRALEAGSEFVPTLGN